MNDNIPQSEVAEQVARQCDAVAHMAEALMNLHRVKAQIVRGAPQAPICVIGPDTAALMETLGDVLNDMDAVDDAHDEWLGSVFKRAHEMFPSPVTNEGAGR